MYPVRLTPFSVLDIYNVDNSIGNGHPPNLTVGGSPASEGPGGTAFLFYTELKAHSNHLRQLRELKSDIFSGAHIPSQANLLQRTQVWESHIESELERYKKMAKSEGF
jgi:hypothetical protein